MFSSFSAVSHVEHEYMRLVLGHMSHVDGWKEAILTQGLRMCIWLKGKSVKCNVLPFKVYILQYIYITWKIFITYICLLNSVA